MNSYWLSGKGIWFQGDSSLSLSHTQSRECHVNVLMMIHWKDYPVSIDMNEHSPLVSLIFSSFSSFCPKKVKSIYVKNWPNNIISKRGSREWLVGRRRRPELTTTRFAERETQTSEVMSLAVKILTEWIFYSFLLMEILFFYCHISESGEQQNALPEIFLLWTPTGHHSRTMREQEERGWVATQTDQKLSWCS